MKVLAMYLPQFHSVKENDEWWGEGFTDWETAKQAKPLYEGHYQPRVPLNHNYYDLIDGGVMTWQADLMKKYQVDGMCMYHYWFEDGKRILEKPAENLLKWKHIDMPFCFCWANETWARSWSNLYEKNVWANTFEPEKKDKAKAVLLKQNYGNKVQWEKHFEYLLPFFKDDRYIKIDGKPVFLILKTNIITCLEQMITCWRDLARSHGLKGLYIIGAEDTPLYLRSCLDARMRIESQNSRLPLWVKSREHGSPCVLEYDDVWSNILNHDIEDDTYPGGFVSYDDSPRRGNEAIIIENGTPEKFQRYLAELIAKNAVNNKEFIFLNAWNEWGEGMYLEPDDKFGYRYLETISKAKKEYPEHLDKYRKQESDCLEKKEDVCSLGDLLERRERSFWLLNRWMTLRDHNCSLAKWFIDMGYRRIALYGYGVFGKHFYQELLSSSVRIQYIIDKCKDDFNVDVPVLLPTDSLPKVDTIVISVIEDTQEIYGFLKSKGVKNIIVLETLLEEYRVD